MQKRMAMVIAGVTTMSVPAYAQQNAEPVGLETVTVTAQKRSEDLQRVPIAIAAFDSRKLEALRIDDMRDLAQAVPGFTLLSVGGASQPFLRGLGIQSSGPWQEASVSTYIDGVYYINPYLSHDILSNLDRIEVIKGPQGTLFGRNAVGGVVSFVTKDPGQESHVDADIGYGNFNTLGGSLYASGGITDSLAADILIAGQDQQDGWGRNLYTEQDIHKSYRYSVRSKWVLTPNDSSKFTLIGDWGRATSAEAGSASLRGIYPFATIGPSHPGGYYDTYAPKNAFILTSQYGVSLKAEVDLSWASFVSISAARHDTNRQQTVYPFNPPFLPDTPAVGQIAGLKTDSLGEVSDRTGTQEFQLLSPASSKITWVTGAYFLYNKSGFDFKTNEVVVPPVGKQNTISFTKQTTHSYSLFAQATAPILADTRLTGGVRYTVDERSVDGYAIRNTVANQDVYTLRPGTTAADNPMPSGTWKKPTFKVALEHDLADQVLTYASFSTGFQSAYYSISSAANSAPLEPVTIKAYEMGVKSDLLDNRLRVNASLFLYDLENIVVSRNIGGTQVQDNAGSSRSKGVDLDVDLQVTENLTLSGSLEYLDAEYTKYPGALLFVPAASGSGFDTVGVNGAGLQQQFTEKFRGNLNANYSIPTRVGELSLVGALNYHSGLHYDIQSLAVQPAYTLLDASAGWTASDGRWDVKLWGKNLTDKKYTASISTSTIAFLWIPAEPRTYGIRVGYRWN